MKKKKNFARLWGPVGHACEKTIKNVFAKKPDWRSWPRSWPQKRPLEQKVASVTPPNKTPLYKKRIISLAVGPTQSEKNSPQHGPCLGGHSSEVKGQNKKIPKRRQFWHTWLQLLKTAFFSNCYHEASYNGRNCPLFKIPKKAKIYYINWKKKKIWRDFEGQWGPTRGPNQKTLLHMARGPDTWLTHIQRNFRYRFSARS